MFPLRVYSTYVLLLSACSAAPVVERRWNGITVQRPSDDPWYYNNSICAFESLSPGDVLDKRAVEIPKFLQNTVSEAWQVKFRTTDSRSDPTWAITTLYKPKNPRTKPGLVSYQHFMDSANVDDSPSYGAIHYNSSEKARVAWEVLVGGISGKNLYINLPDYEGPKAAFGAGHMAGHATLDSLRAVKRAGLIGDNVPIVIWGYSGGALATEWAAELQGTYAPELKITAAIMGGLTPNLTSVFYTTTSPDTLHADLVPKAIQGLAAQYPEVQQDVMKAINVSKPWDDAVHDLYQITEVISLRSTINYLLGRCRIQDLLSKDGMMGNSGVPQMPLLLHHAEYDALAPIEDVRKLKAHYCGPNNDRPITLRVNPSPPTRENPDMHTTEAINAWVTVLGPVGGGWLEDAFAGRLPVNCTGT